MATDGSNDSQPNKYNKKTVHDALDRKIQTANTLHKTWNSILPQKLVGDEYIMIGKHSST